MLHLYSYLATRIGTARRELGRTLPRLYTAEAVAPFFLRIRRDLLRPRCHR